MNIDINGVPVFLQRKKIKNIYLRIRSTGEVNISAPLKTSLNTIHQFLNDKRPWIEKHRHRQLPIEPEAPRNLLEGDYVYFKGERYQVRLHENKTHQRVELNDALIHFFVKPDASKCDKEKLLTKWYITQMEEMAFALLAKWVAVMKVTVNLVKIRTMKSRWGSCHPTKKHITLNLSLIEKPLACLEYVIVHELVHLFEASHNARFYALMSHYLPEWQQVKNQLNSKGS